MFDIYNMNEEELKELKITKKIVNSQEYNFSNEQKDLIISLGNSIIHNFDSGVLEKLFDNDIRIAASFLDLISEFCLISKLSIYGVLDTMLIMDFELFNYKIVKILRDRGLSNIELIVGNFYGIDSIINVSLENKINPTVKSSPEISLETLYEKVEEKIDELQDYMTEFSMNNNPVFYQDVFNNSHDETIKRVIDKIKNVHLPLNQVNLKSKDIVCEIEHQKNTFNDIFTNKRILSKINQNNHFFDYLKKDELEITDDYKIIFKRYTKASSIGYTDKAILLSINKNKAIRELERKIKSLKDYQTEGSEELIDFTKKLIKFISQKKH